MFELLRVFVFPSHTSNLMSRFVKDVVKVLSQTLLIFLGLFLRMAPASLLPSSATFLSTDQLSHHSHFYPPATPSMTTTTSPLDDPLSRSLTFSLRLIPLTMHVPKTDLIFFRGATPTLSPTPPAPPTPVPSDSPAPAYLPNPNLVPSSCPSPHHTSQLHHLEPHPWPPHHVLPGWNLGACVTGPSTNPEPFAGIKL